MKYLASLLETGSIKPFVSQVFGFNEIASAHLQVEGGHTVGKVAVKL